MKELKILKDIKNEETYFQFREHLFSIAEETYRKFQKKIIPNYKNIIGIRSPILKNIAKEIAKGNYENYFKTFEFLHKKINNRNRLGTLSSISNNISLNNLEESEFTKERCNKANNIFTEIIEKNKIIYHEEKVLYSYVLNFVKEDYNYKIKKIDFFISLIDNWAICDSLGIGFNFVKKNKKDFFKILLTKIEKNKSLLEDSINSWELRFIFVALYEFFIDKEHINEIFKICDELLSDEYYVNMSKAWLLSICYVELEEETFNYLKNCKLDKWTVNKTVQKIRESLRISPEVKEKVLTLKRK